MTDPTPTATPTPTPTAAPSRPPAPANPNHARATLIARSADRVVLGLPGTSYQLQLGVLREPGVEPGKTITGVIRLDARRVDIVKTGGRYIEPVYGRPRRVQGAVVAVDAANRTITVNAAAPIVARLQKGQSADQFKVGDFVSFDCMPGASFTPA